MILKCIWIEAITWKVLFTCVAIKTRNSLRSAIPFNCVIFFHSMKRFFLISKVWFYLELALLANLYFAKFMQVSIERVHENDFDLHKPVPFLLHRRRHNRTPRSLRLFSSIQDRQGKLKKTAFNSHDSWRQSVSVNTR